MTRRPRAVAAIVAGLVSIVASFGGTAASPAGAVPPAGTAVQGLEFAEFHPGTGPNLAAGVEDFTTKDWRTDQLTVASATEMAPDGKSRAFRLAETASSSRHRMEATISGLSPGTYTTSLYVKPGERHAIQFEIRDHDPGKYGVVRFDLEKKAVVSQTGDVVAAGLDPLPDGWLRCWAAMPYATDSAIVNFALMTDPGTLVYPGDPKAGLLVWGVQLEPGEKPQDYSSGS